MRGCAEECAEQTAQSARPGHGRNTEGEQGLGSPTAPGTSGAPGTQVYCSPPSSSLPAEQNSVNSTLLSHNPKSWVPEQGLIQRAPRPMAGLHSPALLPPGFCLHPNNTSLAVSSSPNYESLLVARSLVGCGKPMLLCLQQGPTQRTILPARASFKAFPGQAHDSGNYSIQFLWRKQSPKDKALLTTWKKEPRSPGGLFFAHIPSLRTSCWSPTHLMRTDLHLSYLYHK